MQPLVFVGSSLAVLQYMDIRSSLRLFPLLLGGLVGLVIGGSAPPLYAQEEPSPWKYSATLFGSGSTSGSLPFWLHANQYGIADPQSANAGLRLRSQRSFTTKRGPDYEVGGELLGRASSHSTAYVHELYGRLQYQGIQLTAGRYEQKIVGRSDSTLSLGQVTWSPNASPIPKISISSNGYLSIPGTGNALAVNGYFAHGWLEEDRFVQNALLHEKYLYVRLLSPEAPVRAHVGMTHHATWGGTHPQRGEQPSDFIDWAYVVRGRSRVTDTGARATGVNQLASYDFSLDATVKGIDTRLYRQFYHEDTPSLWFRNPWDGLWGLSLRREDDAALVTALLWEHFRMTRHNAKFSEGEERGEDTYYDHSVYRSGWTYQGRTLGVPLITTPSTTPGVDDALPGIANSIVVAHHLGVEGMLRPNLSYQLLGTYSRNYGAQGVCETPSCRDRIDRRTSRKDQYSFRVSLRTSLLDKRNLWLRTAVAFDTGELYDDRMGLSVQLTWKSRPSND
mgnify:CR=1 FL=1